MESITKLVNNFQESLETLIKELEVRFESESNPITKRNIRVNITTLELINKEHFKTIELSSLQYLAKNLDK